MVVRNKKSYLSKDQEGNVRLMKEKVKALIKKANRESAGFINKYA